MDMAPTVTSMTDALGRLEGITEQLKAGETPSRVTVRSFLSWFGAQRRGFYKVRAIRAALDGAGLMTDPDFEGAYIDSEIGFRLNHVDGGQTPRTPYYGNVLRSPSFHDNGFRWAQESSDTVSDVPYIGGAVADPTYRIGKLAAANNAPVYVVPDAALIEATTLMLQNDYSQLPVMQDQRNVKGVISWKSIGSRLALGCSGSAVRDYMEADNPTVVSADDSLFTAIPAIVEHEYVLVRSSEKRIVGIVTTSDLSLQFRQLAEPFLLLGEIENHIRRLIDRKFTAEEIRAACDPDDSERQVETVADLTFGEYLRLLEQPDHWTTVGLELDRRVFLKQLERVREIRNDVMHFDPDPIAAEELSLLRRCAQFLQGLQRMGVS